MLTNRTSSGNILMTDENRELQSQYDTVSNQSDEVVGNEEGWDHDNSQEEERDEESHEQSQNFRTTKGEEVWMRKK